MMAMCLFNAGFNLVVNKHCLLGLYLFKNDGWAIGKRL